MLFLFIVLAGVLLACTAQAAPAPTETPTALPPTATTLPSATARPTAVPTVTPTPLSPDAQALKDIVFSDCIPVEEGLPEGFEIPWNLLVKKNRAVYILDLEDVTKTELPHFYEAAPEGHFKFADAHYVSPDGKWLAYPDIFWTMLFVEPAKTLLTNEDADRIIFDKGHDIGFISWVDNETMLATYPKPGGNAFYPTVVLNPFTGEEHVFVLEEMPSHLSRRFGGALLSTHYYGSGELVPDPSMKRLIYPKESDGPEVNNILWNIEKEEALASLPYMFGDINHPLWSQDGSDVLLVGPNLEFRQYFSAEWFLITSSGVVNQITHFQDLFPDEFYYISGSSRSGNGELLAFRLTYHYDQPEESTKDFVLNVKTDTLDGFCIPATIGTNYGTPKWSPDSKYLILFNIDSNATGEDVFINIETQTAYKIAQDMQVIGWIAKPEGEK